LNITKLVSKSVEVNGMRSNALRVIAYHRINDLKSTPRLDPRLISATPPVFERQMRYVARHFHVISMVEVLNAVAKGIHLPKRALLITFDDAYVDFATHAWPILKKLHLPVTVFVPTAYPDHPDRAFWWDRLHRAFSETSEPMLNSIPIGPLSLRTKQERDQNLRKLRSYTKTLPHAQAMAMVDEICAELGCQPMDQKSVLSWEELRQLAEEGVTLGAHTQTHPVLTQLPLKQIRQEVIESQQDLKREIGSVLPIFCYPNGNCNDTVIKVLQEEGFKAAFTMLEGHNYLGSVDPLRLCRTSITKRTSPLIFRLRLLPLFSYLDKWRQRKQSMIH
jgi:peptidoglycan/xylan/chitin deacetylase (PgdA/CDA1 family)